MGPDEHAEEARLYLAQAETATNTSTALAAPLAQLATAHFLAALLDAQEPLVVQETTSTDEMATFTQAQGLDDIRDWHADAAPKADQLDDFDAWLHVRDVGKLLDHIDHQDHILRRSDQNRERLRAKAGQRTAALRRMIEEPCCPTGEETARRALGGTFPPTATTDVLRGDEPTSPSTGEDQANLTDSQFRALMDLVMVSDPTPLVDAADRALTGLLDSEATSRGFDSWHVAYHELHRSTGENQSGDWCGTCGRVNDGPFCPHCHPDTEATSPDCGHSYILGQFDKAHDALDALGVVPSSEDASVDERIEALGQRLSVRCMRPGGCVPSDEEAPADG